MAERIEEYLWKLEIPLVGNPLKNLNSYLLTGGERSLLIDTGFDQTPCWEAMDAQLRQIGVDRDRMDIFLTHLHSDHTGLVPHLAQGDGKVYISEIDGPLLNQGLSDQYWRRVYRSYVENGFSWEEISRLWEKNPAQCAAPKQWDGRFVYLRDGDLLEYGGQALQCILTPGHTPGHMCLYGKDAQWLFSGDHVLFHITPNICRWESMPDALGSYLESLDKLCSLPVAQLFPAHRQERGDLRQRITELKAHHDRRICNTLEVVGRNPGLTAYEIAGKMSWSIRSRNWTEFPLTQKFFAVGETLAHLDYLAVRGRVACREGAGKIRYYSLD